MVNKIEYLYKEETYKIIGVAQEVHRDLGSGFLETVYQDAMEIEFRTQNIPYKREFSLPIYYKEIKNYIKYASNDKY